MSDNPKSFHLSPEMHTYLLEHGTAPDAIAQGLIAATNELGGISIMQIAPEQGALMTMLTRLIGARRAIEVGTFTGYSALAIARGLPEDGQLICCDVSDEWAKIGIPFWEEAGVRDRIDLRIAPALETLQSIKEDGAFDLAFIDADKPNYANYVEELARLVRPGGLILVDNVLWMGAVIDREASDDNTLAIRAFNAKVAADDRFDCVMLPVSDGLTFLRVR
ncbi:MAG: class I SAM-dependent methyltransferase [Myxococcota bacterium]|jgi:caffeoyl-CoA O-methyltransferase|nr:class I SAM-dependent methyltransferase [Myxococcota bacterium]